MSSTDLEAPPLRLILAAIIVAVGLHILTAIALVVIKTPELKVDKKETPPIEIELITLPPPPPIEIEETKIEEEVEVVEVAPKEEPKPQVAEPQPPKPKAKPVAQPKPKAPAKPIVREEKKEVKTEPEAPNLEEPRTLSSSNNRPLNDPPPKSKSDSSNETNTSKLGGLVDNSSTTIIGKEPVTRTKAVQDGSENKGLGGNKPNIVGNSNTSPVNTPPINNKAPTSSSVPVDTGPVSLNASEATWRSGREPNLGFLEKAAKVLTNDVSIKVKITVDEKGNIVDAELLSRTGNNSIDGKIRRAMKKAKLNPFIRNGVAVKGTVTLPIVYNVK